MTDLNPSNQNPYAAATGNISLHSDVAATVNTPQTDARRLGFWQFFLGIILLAIFGIVVLILGLQMLLAGVLAGSIAGVIGVGLVILIMAFFYLLPAISIMRAGATAKQYSVTPDAVQQTLLLERQLRTWRVLGSLALLGVVFSFSALALTVGRTVTSSPPGALGPAVRDVTVPVESDSLQPSQPATSLSSEEGT
ncbi:hypothetical protein FF011L_17840 [Roseimaritima multifibrata]|uniref:Uncharacterized protein n=1 Tax=Roseimaritima multifibrata TaxID=1930274 RepID=A0A517MDR6_9BACT|nr:hypothetical protein [Roseimaritima multifibrata]QDS93029.1 hypothetical protein FF011L_17840 [Roseimaritima multifibrata]